MALFTRSRSIVALDIGSSHIKLLELEVERGGRRRLKHFGIAPVPPEAIVDGAFMNTGAVVATIRELIARHKVKTRDAAVAISGNSVIIKRISLPLMTQQELDDSITWEAEQYIPFDVNDVNIDAHILKGGGDGSGQMDVLLVAARKAAACWAACVCWARCARASGGGSWTTCPRRRPRGCSSASSS